MIERKRNTVREIEIESETATHKCKHFAQIFVSLNK